MLPVIPMKNLIIPLLIILCSCNNNNPIEGVWITVSSYNQGNKPSQNIAQSIYDFESDSLVKVSLGNHASGDYGEVKIELYKYDISNNQLSIYFDNDTLSGSYLLNDSLIISFYVKEENVNRSIVLKRVDLEKKLSQPLEGSYLLKWEEDSSNLNFINDSVCIGLGRVNGVKWKVINYKGADLFMYQDGMTPIASIWNQNKDIINLKYHYRPNREVTLNKLDEIESKERFLGKWTKYYSDELPPPPPHPTAEDFELEMTFSLDTLEIHYWNGIKKKYWKITDDGKNIYFPNNIMERGGCWIIENNQMDTLIFFQGRLKEEKWFKKTTGNKK